MFIKSLAEFIFPNYREASTCEACGTSFTCGATLTGCWCSEIDLSDEARATLRERYSRCLCRACLEQQATPRLSIPNPPPQ